MDITVIVPTHNRAQSLRRTLGALRAQVVPSGLSVEVIVVDNASRDRTAEVAGEASASGGWPIRYLYEPRLGVSQARNRGIREARGAVLAFTDDDTVPQPDWLRALWETFEEHEAADCVGGKILPRWLAQPPRWLLDRPTLLGHLALLDRGERLHEVKVGEWGWIWGANLGFRRAAIERVGGFEPWLGARGTRLFRGEDGDMVRRIALNGGKVLYQPKAVVLHCIGPDRMRLAYFRRIIFDSAYGRARLSGDPSTGKRAPLWRYRQCVQRGVDALRGRLLRSASFLEHELAAYRELGTLLGSAAFHQQRQDAHGRPHTIAYVHPTPVLYGAEQSLLATLNSLDRTKFIPQLVLFRDGPLADAARGQGVGVSILPWLVQLSWRRPLTWLSAAVRFSRWLRRRDIKCVEVNHWLESVDLGAIRMAAAWAGARCVLRLRGAVPRWLSLYDKWWISRMDRIIPVSEEARAALCRPRRSDWWARIRPEHITVIPSGRDLHALKQSAAVGNGQWRSALGIPERTAIIGMVAAMTPRKRQDVFIRAAARVTAVKPATTFIIVGSPYDNSPRDQAYVREVEALIRELGLERHVVCTGFRQDVPHLLASFDVAVLPSRQEALGGALIEAMALGVPVVASAAVGVRDVISREQAGWIVDSDDPGAYADAILNLLNNPALSERMGRNGMRAAERFDARRVTRQTERCYFDALRCVTVEPCAI